MADGNAGLTRQVQVLQSQVARLRFRKQPKTPGAVAPAANSGIPFKFVAPTELASGTAGVTWATVSAAELVPQGASAIYLQFHADGGGNTVDCLIEYRANSAGDVYSPINMIPCQSVGDAMANDNAMFLPLDGSAISFDYQVTAVLNPNWSITLLGYIS